MARRINVNCMTEEEYLREEERATVRHEYVDGYVFAMTGSTEAHNVICGNIFSFLHGLMIGGPCRAFMNDMKVHAKLSRSYYYPDIMVTCEPFDPNSVFKSTPVLLVEILSPSTSAIDRREKLIAYRKIESLKEYLIVHQDQQKVEIHRRADNSIWETFVLTASDDLVIESLPERKVLLPFSVIYQGYNPPMRVKEIEEYYDPIGT